MKSPWLLNFMVFILALVLGYNFSTRFYHSNSDTSLVSAQAIASKDQSPFVTLNNGQRNILVISVTSVHASHPILENIWLATYLAIDGDIHFLPIYPDGKQSISSFEGQLAQAFAIDMENGKLNLSRDFVEILQKGNYQWSGYILVDEDASRKILELLSSVEDNREILSGNTANRGTSPLLDLDESDITTQPAIIRAVCERLSSLASHPAGTLLISNLLGYTITNLDTSQLKADVLALLSNKQSVVCRFPMLEMSSMLR